MPGNPAKDIFRSLADKNLLLPYLKNAVLANQWPDSYDVKVDSSPYYGTGDGYFHPSTHGLMGARQLYYLFHPEHAKLMVPEQRDVTQEMTLTMGSSLHAVVQTQFQMANILRPENVEVEYIIDEHHVRGRIDMIVDHPTNGLTVTEIKTRNSRGYDFGKLEPKWIAQLSMALYGLGYAQGVLLELEAGYPYRMREYRVNRDDDLLAEIFTKFDYVRECIANNTPPEYCCAKGSADMKNCMMRYACWLRDKVIDEQSQ